MRESTIFVQSLVRDLRIYMQHKSESFATLLFFVLITTLFPLIVNPWPQEFLLLVPCIVWISALLASVLTQEQQMRSDYQHGIFEQMIIAPHSFVLLIASKILANWIVTGLPIILITPLICVAFDLPSAATQILTLSLLLGTPILSLVGTIGAALTIVLPRGGLLLAVLVLPLYIPILILGTSATVVTLQGFNGVGQLALLAALLIFSSIFAPLAASAAIKVSIT